MRLMTAPSDAAWLNRREYPFRSRWWRTEAGRMHYVDEGSGDPVVFVHGVPTWSYNFRGLIRRLAGTHRCVAVDHVGFGLSDKPPNWTYEPQELVRHLEHLVTGLGLRNLTLVVHDWGGPIGLAHALRHPDNVARLVLFNTWMWSAKGDLRARMIASLLASPLYMSLEDRFATTARLFTRLAVARRGTVSAETLRHYVEPFRRRQDRAGLRALVRAIHRSDAWVGSLWEERRRIAHIPTLILWGMRDPAFPARYLERWTALFQSAEVHRLEAVGHYPHEEAAETVEQRVGRFLAAPGTRSDAAF
jgi:haloalkane dehalogenase